MSSQRLTVLSISLLVLLLVSLGGNWRIWQQQTLAENCQDTQTRLSALRDSLQSQTDSLVVRRFQDRLDAGLMCLNEEELADAKRLLKEVMDMPNPIQEALQAAF